MTELEIANREWKRHLDRALVKVDRLKEDLANEVGRRAQAESELESLQTMLTIASSKAESLADHVGGMLYELEEG